MIVSTAQDLPIGVAVCGANRQDATFTGEALASVVVELPVALPRDRSKDQPQGHTYKSGKLTRASLREYRTQLKEGQDVRALPYLRADGNFAKIPAQLGAKQQGFRLWAPQKQQSRRGLGIIRSSVERTHSLLNQFGRLFRRLDRKAEHYLAWAHFACCVIFMRRGFFP